MDENNTLAAEGGQKILAPFLCAKSSFQWEFDNNMASSKVKSFVGVIFGIFVPFFDHFFGKFFVVQFFNVLKFCAFPLHPRPGRGTPPPWRPSI